MARSDAPPPDLDALWEQLTCEARGRLMTLLQDEASYLDPPHAPCPPSPPPSSPLLTSYALLDQLPMGMVFMDAEWRIMHCLGYAEDQLGAAREAILGQPLGAFFTPETRANWCEDLVTQGHTSLQQETQLVRGDGTQVDVEVRLQKLRGEAVCWVVIIHDITQRRELEEELRQAQKMEVLGLLTSGIAHDLNNLLTVMLGHIELAEDELSAMHPALQDLEGIRAAVDRAAAMTVKLLAFARAQIVEPRPIDLIEVFNQLRPLLKQSLNEEIQLNASLRVNRATVLADTIQLEQLLINLIINARDAIGAKAGHIHVDISRRKATQPRSAVESVIAPGMYVVMSVSDDGSGIAQEHLARIFEPFFTTKLEGKGTGLGLATCLRIVHQNRGHIRCESALDEGTCFEIWLPAARAPQSSIPPISSMDLAREGGALLVVEDEPALRHSIQRALTRYGYDVEVARNGNEALAMLARGTPFDLLVTDVVMPDMGGGALVEQLKHHRPHLPVLYISGYSDEMLATRGIQQSKIEFLAKPFSPRALAIRVQEILLASASRLAP